MLGRHGVRPAIATCLVLAIPLVMTVVDRDKPDGQGWRWGVLDFVIMGALLFSAGWTYEVVRSRVTHAWQAFAVGSGILAVVFAIWVELAVDGVSKFVAWVRG